MNVKIGAFKKSIKGISPIIAALLMIAIVVVASLITYGWVTGYLNFTTTKTGNAIQIQSASISSSAIPAESGNLIIYVQNVGMGSFDLTSNSIYVDDIHRSIVSINSVQSLPYRVNEGETVTVIVDFPLTDSHQKHDVKVVSSGGASYTVQVSDLGESTIVTPPITHGVISIAFDDGTQNVFDNAVPILDDHDVKATFYIISDYVGMANYVSASELVSLQSRGHDIGSHSKSHYYLPNLSEDVIREQCSLSKTALESYGLTINNFAFPYGGTNEQANSIALEYYHSVRSAYAEPFLMPVGSSGVLTGYHGESNPWLSSKLDEVAASNSWTIVFFHNVVNSYSDLPEDERPYSITSAEFSTFIDYALSKGIQILSVEQALDLTASE